MEKPQTLQKIVPVTELRLPISSIQGNGMIPCFQMIYMIIAGYFEDDASDELTKVGVCKTEDWNQ